MSHQSISRGGKTYFLVEQGEYEKVFGGASYLPPLPKPNADGTVDAIRYARASIAREIVTRRQAAGMTQTELARAAGVRVETLNRIENAKHTADVVTLAKLEAALPARGETEQGGRRRGKHVETNSGFRKTAAGRATGKRELVNTGTDQRSVRRDSSGSFTERNDVGGGRIYRRKADRGTTKRTTNRKK